MQTDGQLLIGTTVPNAGNTNINVGKIVGSGGVSVGYSSPNITVSLSGGGTASTSFDVDIATLTGTDPVVPTALGVVSITGAQAVASTVGANVIRSNSTAPNSLTMQIQQSGSAATENTALNGVSHFDSDIFTVSNGFVSTTGGTLVQSISAGPGVTITGTAAVPIINSVVYTSTAAGALAINNGYFATGAGTYTMPNTSASGSLIEIVCDAAGVIVDPFGSTLIRLGNSITTVTTGTITSTAVGDSLIMRYRSSNLTWYVMASVGNWTIT